MLNLLSPRFSEAWVAHAEGCWPKQEERSFELWLVQVALPHALRCEPVTLSD